MTFSSILKNWSCIAFSQLSLEFKAAQKDVQEIVLVTTVSLNTIQLLLHNITFPTTALRLALLIISLHPTSLLFKILVITL